MKKNSAVILIIAIIAIFVLGGVFRNIRIAPVILVIAVVLFIQRNRKRADHSEDRQEDDAPEEKQEPEPGPRPFTQANETYGRKRGSVIICEYCGSTIDTEKHAVCNHCGASYRDNKEWKEIHRDR